ncbi:MAG TPA: hypothetical protein VMU81_22595 [Acetobacteraceae bacterium]|nr:hypothetical protein [Acetobacteraceae bacterium]
MATKRDTERARERRARAEWLKAELNVRHAAAPDEYLAGHPKPPDPLPFPAVTFVTAAPSRQRRKHRATGKPVGHPVNDDAPLARGVHGVTAAFDVDQDAAVRTVAEFIEDTSNVSTKAARARVRRAVQKSD